jgi:hypothetical protein
VDTFVVRIWRPADAAGVALQSAGTLHGTVDHVRTAQSRTFRDEEELVRFLRACFQADDPDKPEGGTP